MKGVLAREPDSRFFLFYGNRATDNIMFLEALEELKDRFINASRSSTSSPARSRTFRSCMAGSTATR